MKLQLSVSARDLPAQADTYAIVKVDGVEVGRTAVEKNTDDPCWSKILVLEAKTSQSVSVQVLQSDSDTEFGSSDFSIHDVLAQEGSALAKSMENGGAVAVHIEPHTENGMLQLQLRGKKFKNMEGFMNKSDPYFEIKGPEGRIVYRSNVVQDNLNPVWPAAAVSIQDLANGDMDAPIEVRIYDRDGPDGSRDFMGKFELSVNGFLTAREPIGMQVKSGKKTGEIHVLGASLVPQDDVSEKAKEAMEVVSAAEVERWAAENRIRSLKQTAEKKGLAAAAAQTLADDTKQAASSKKAVAEKLEQEVAEAELLVIELEEKANQAAADAKAKSCSGIFQVALRGSNFEDKDGFQNISDPYFEVYGAKGESVFLSAIISNNLNPVWPTAEIDLFDLCNGDLDMPIRVAFYDSDEGTTKKDYFGQFQMSVNAFLEANPDEPIDMIKGGIPTVGKVYLNSTPQIVDYKDLKEEAANAREASLEAKRQVYTQSEALKAAQDDAKVAESAAEEAASAAKVAVEVAQAAKEALEKAEAV